MMILIVAVLIMSGLIGLMCGGKLIPLLALGALLALMAAYDPSIQRSIYQYEQNRAIAQVKIEHQRQLAEAALKQQQAQEWDAFRAWCDNLYDGAHTFWSAHLSLILLTAFAVWLVWLSTRVIRKWQCIRATAIGLGPELMRCEPTEPEERWQAARSIVNSLFVDAQAFVARARQNGLNINLPEARAFFEAAQYVSEFKKREDQTFLLRRRVMRWLVDSFVAMVGEFKSVDEAWSKAIQALEEFHEESKLRRVDQRSLAQLPNLAKSLHLPWYPQNQWRFRRELDKAVERKKPRGALTFWLATRFFDYKKYLKYGVSMTTADGQVRWLWFQGEEAFKAIEAYQAFQAMRMQKAGTGTSDANARSTAGGRRSGRGLGLVVSS